MILILHSLPQRLLLGHWCTSCAFEQVHLELVSVVCVRQHFSLIVLHSPKSTTLGSPLSFINFCFFPSPLLHCEWCFGLAWKRLGPTDTYVIFLLFSHARTVAWRNNDSFSQPNFFPLRLRFRLWAFFVRHFRRSFPVDFWSLQIFRFSPADPRAITRLLLCECLNVNFPTFLAFFFLWRLFPFCTMLEVPLLHDFNSPIEVFLLRILRIHPLLPLVVVLFTLSFFPTE